MSENIKHLAEQTFLRYDRNHSGFLEHSEIRALLEVEFKEFGVGVTDADIKAMITMTRHPHDDKISKEDYIQMVVDAYHRTNASL